MPESPTALEHALETTWQVAGEWSAVDGRAVVRATDKTTGELVRILAVSCAEDGMATARLAREIGVLLRLAHQAAVLPLLDSGRLAGWLYAVTPWRDLSLRTALERSGPMPVDDAMAHTIDVADLLHFAHGLGVTHGAVSADALFSDSEQVQLGEFSSALCIRTESERPRAATRDVFGLSCALYEMLSGARWVANGRIPDALPEPLIHFLHRALGPDRHSRFATAIAFAQALCAVRDAISDHMYAVTGRDAMNDLPVEELPLSDGADRSLRVLHALLDRAEVADMPPEPDDPLIAYCWERAGTQVRADDARLVALRCRWRLLAAAG